MSESTEPEKRRGPLDPPRWMDGFPSLFSSGLLALGGVMAGMSAFLLCVLLAVGKVPAATAIPWILAVGALSPILLFLHGRAERHAGIPSGPSSPGYLPVAPDRRRSNLEQWILGHEGGSLARDGDGLLLRTRLVRQWPLPVAYVLLIRGMDNHASAQWLFVTCYGFVFADMLLSVFHRRSERIPRERLAAVVLCGNYLVLRLAGTPEPEPRVLRIEHFQRARATALLAPLAPFEELPAPRHPGAPVTARTPPPPPAGPGALHRHRRREGGGPRPGAP